MRQEANASVVEMKDIHIDPFEPEKPHIPNIAAVQAEKQSEIHTNIALA